ncbi:MAG: V-type ATPase subunit subunit G family protein [Nitrospirota bacterium]
MADINYNDSSVIDKIHKTEDKIEKMLKGAGDEADKIIKDARAKADEILKRGAASLKGTGDEYQKNRLNEAEKEAERIIAKTDSITEKLRSSSEKRIKDAVDLVIKKVLP